MSHQFSTSFIAEFWSRVKKTESCWLWIGGKTKSGYGQIRSETKMVYAHRTSWELHRGAIPEGMEVCHDCPDGDNPACVNPSHLFVGTHVENVQDMYNKGREARGENHGSALLTDASVTAIRMRFFAGSTHQSLANEFGVAIPTINHIVNRRTWTHLPLVPGEDRDRESVQKGMNNPNVKLTDELVWRIRQTYETGNSSLARLARDFSVSKKTILNIVKRRIWKHVA